MVSSLKNYLNQMHCTKDFADVSYTTASLTKSNDDKHLLGKLINQGVKIFHFESHCFNSQAQETVGEVVGQLVYDNEISRDSLFFCVKGGYFESKYSTGDEFEFKLDSNFVHNLNASLIRKSIKDSLIRLGVNTLDAYIIQDPDYFFSRSNIKTLSLKEQRSLFHEYLIELFFVLENEVQENRINAYGISFDTFIFNKNFSDLFNFSEFFKLLNEKISNHHFLIFECPFNIVDSSLAVKHKGISFFEQLRSHNVFVFTNRPFLTFFKNMSFLLTEYSEPEDISIMEIEDMIASGIELEQHLKSQLSEFEEIENEVDYLVFFEQIANYFDVSKGILTFQNIIQKGIFPAVEQYMNLISEKPYLIKINDQIDTYFSQFNLIIRSMSNYLMLIHNSEISVFKSKLQDCNKNYVSDFQLKLLLLSAYINTPEISCVILSVESEDDLALLDSFNNKNTLGRINWDQLNLDINDY